MITIRILKIGHKPLIAHVKNDADCKMWLKLFSGDFDAVEIKHEKKKDILRFESKYKLSQWMHQ